MARNRELGHILQKGSITDEYIYYERLYDDGHFSLYKGTNNCVFCEWYFHLFMLSFIIHN